MRTKRWGAVLGVATVAQLAVLTVLVLGRYAQRADAADVARVAVIAAGVQTQTIALGPLQAQRLSTDSTDTTQGKVDVTVTNVADDGTVAEVALQYTLRVDVQASGLPLSCVLLNGQGEQGALHTDDESGVQYLEWTGTLPAAKKAKDVYSLQVAWDAKQGDSYLYQDRLIYLPVVVEAVQGS